MTTKDPAIAPCPFCGYVGLEFREGSTFRWLIADCGGSCGCSLGETRIQTLGEGTKEEWMAQAQSNVIEVWNTRKPAPDCRTCEYMWVDVDLEKATSKESCARSGGAVCINGSLHKPAPKVVLWRTE